MIKMYWKIGKDEFFVGEKETFEEAFRLVIHHQKLHSSLESYYQRFLLQENEIVIDYGAHNAFYYLRKDGIKVDYEKFISKNG